MGEAILKKNSVFTWFDLEKKASNPFLKSSVPLVRSALAIISCKGVLELSPSSDVFGKWWFFISIVEADMKTVKKRMEFCDCFFSFVGSFKFVPRAFSIVPILWDFTILKDC